MKKVIILCAALAGLSLSVYADGSAFTPLNFDDTTYGGSYAPTSYSSSSSVISDEAIGNTSIQTAISELDSAQADIRADLINYKTKFADIDAQYKLVKSERATLKKQIKSIEKRIKDIDKAKENIRKNML